MARQIRKIWPDLAAITSIQAQRRQLQTALPAGGARNALDCALWDMEAKRSGISVADRLGTEMHPLLTAFTLSLDTPERMAASARRQPAASPLKLKLGENARADIARVEAVRDARPDARLLVDVNEGWSLSDLKLADPELARLGVELIEQPLPREHDGLLNDWRGKLPLCADESFDEASDLRNCQQRYSFVNVKLDKCGGLTEALEIASQAKRDGMGLFVGSMLGTSLGMMPAAMMGQVCDYVDLDGASWLARDRPDAMGMADGRLICDASPWGKISHSRSRSNALSRLPA
jgi:L-alanine-DL-glutamate epimerase-like enolase superfamily enzyme